ncbi:hypothetical protein PYCCODRAFT_799280 [Trametes coccinea BRFM310]|uniref:F-box domain-containing protein n=1 Tax=Trametes coccinea (strain BRFM310) TaxID=1353009 RepID=A0A1Y2J2U1_TRAC3|nr:hypothetical protein PYCCODRAFT_799280 [Trametes coccinea BRFM310]
MCAFEQMPALEELCLSVAPPAGTGHALVFCSPEWHGSFPWPRLKRLVVSYPDPDDKLYSLLFIADTLQCLDLRCWPRHYIHLSPDDRVHMRQLRWRSPILTSFELLRLFGRCHSRHLTELAIEYSEDEDDLELLKNIPISFPNLETLIFYRYRRLRTDNVPIRAIGEALAFHPRLRVVYAHLDLSGTPQPWVNCYYRNANDRLARHRQVLVDAARELAQGLEDNRQ